MDRPSAGPSLPFVLAQTTLEILVLQSGKRTHTSGDAKRGFNVATRALGNGRRPQGGSEGAYAAYAWVCLHLSVLGFLGTCRW